MQRWGRCGLTSRATGARPEPSGRAAGDLEDWEGVWAIRCGRVEYRVVCEQRLQQRGLVRKEDDTLNDSQVLEEGASVAEFGAHLAPEVVEAVEFALESDVRQVDNRQQVRQSLSAVPEIVLEVIWERSRLVRLQFLSGIIVR